MKKLICLCMLFSPLAYAKALPWPTDPVQQVKAAKTIHELVCTGAVSFAERQLCQIYGDSSRKIEVKTEMLNDSTIQFTGKNRTVKVERTNKSDEFLLNGIVFSLSQYSTQYEVREALDKLFSRSSARWFVFDEANADDLENNVNAAIQRLLASTERKDMCQQIRVVTDNCIQDAQNILDYIKAQTAKYKKGLDKTEIESKLQKLNSDIGVVNSKMMMQYLDVHTCACNGDSSQPGCKSAELLNTDLSQTFAKCDQMLVEIRQKTDPNLTLDDKGAGKTFNAISDKMAKIKASTVTLPADSGSGTLIGR